MNVFKRSSYVLKRTGKSLDASGDLKFMLKCLLMIRLFSTRNLYFELDVETVDHADNTRASDCPRPGRIVFSMAPAGAVLSRCLRRTRFDSPSFPPPHCGCPILCVPETSVE